MAYRLWHQMNISRRMLKKSIQQGRRARRGEAYASVRWAPERGENDAGGLFQQSARDHSDARHTIAYEAPRIPIVSHYDCHNPRTWHSFKEVWYVSAC